MHVDSKVTSPPTAQVKEKLVYTKDGNIPAIVAVPRKDKASHQASHRHLKDTVIIVGSMGTSGRTADNLPGL